MNNSNNQKKESKVNKKTVNNNPNPKISDLEFQQIRRKQTITLIIGLICLLIVIILTIIVSIYLKK